jgi:hypothetical protein
VGTDDGNIQLTRDGGTSWTNLRANLRGVPPNTWVSRVEASSFDPAVAYVTLDGHRRSDMKPYLATPWRDLDADHGGLSASQPFT